MLIKEVTERHKYLDSVFGGLGLHDEPSAVLGDYQT